MNRCWIRYGRLVYGLLTMTVLLLLLTLLSKVTVSLPVPNTTLLFLLPLPENVTVSVPLPSVTVLF